MSYVFDNSPLSTLFRNYYPQRFPTLWKRFDKIVADGALVSTREVLREIDGRSNGCALGRGTMKSYFQRRPKKRVLLSLEFIASLILSRILSSRRY